MIAFPVHRVRHQPILGVHQIDDLAAGGKIDPGRAWIAVLRDAVVDKIMLRRHGPSRRERFLFGLSK